jgi:putative PIN family toxin of toxin-antitoxin system
MAKKLERIVIDTNLWISFLLSKDFKKLDEQIKKGKVKLIFSVELIDEFLTVAARSKFRKFFSKRDIEELIELFDSYGEIIQVNSQVDICRDHKDNFILSLLKDSKADYLLTGDNDLLELKEFYGTRILKLTDYLRRSG